MPHAIWTGSISFGLVNIPVKIYSAVQDSTLDLDMLDKKDHANIRFKRVNENTGREVAYTDIVKGYNYNDEYVVLDADDFKAAAAEKTNTIDISGFVDQEEIDPIYYEQPYYLAPQKNGERAYGMLRDALAHAGKVGVSTFVMRSKEAPAVLRPYGNVIVLNRLRFAEEIRDPDELGLPPHDKGKSREKEMAVKLIEQLSQEFDINEFHDTYSDKLMKIIEDKSKGKRRPARPLKVVHKRTSDLMAALEASLTKKKKRKAS
jgi:DNA end-binding protein Ku